MRKPLTDSVMLAAARRQLAEHLDTHPATADEAAYIRQAMLRRANDLRALAKPWSRYSLNYKAEAASIELHAAAWHGDMTHAWNATKAALEARVAYYEQLCTRNA